MGTWGVNPFDNDDAGDWLDGLRGQADLAYIEEPLDTVLAHGHGYLEAPEGQLAIIAAETVALLQGHWGEGGGTVRSQYDWIPALGLKPSPGLAIKARQAIERVATEPSELLELWSEGPDVQAWKQSLQDLARRIAG